MQHPKSTRRSLKRASPASCSTWGDALREALDEAIGGLRARALAARYANAFSAAYQEAFGGAQAITDIETLESLSEARPRAVDLYRREGDPATRVNLKVLSRGASLPLSERVPLLENLGFRVVNERTYRVVPAGASETERVWLHDMTLERSSGGAIDIGAIQGPIEAALLALFQGLAESDGFNRLVLEALLGWRDVAMVRALGRYLRQIRHTVRPGLPRLHACAPPRHRGQIVALFYARFDPRAEDGCAPRAKPASAPRSRSFSTRSRASTTTGSCAASSTSSRRRCGPTSSRSIPTACQGQYDLLQVRSRQGRRPAAAEAVLRDLRLLAASRGRASALRHGGARRPALVGPAAGLPHRGARPRQGAAGQERRHRAGRRQGRLLPQAAAARRRPAGLVRRGHRQPTRSSSAPCSSSPTTSWTTASCPPPDYGAARRRRSLFRRRRRQGHGDLLRHRQRDLRRGAASGSTTLSPPAAQPATTTRRWALPPRAPGRR